MLRLLQPSGRGRTTARRPIPSANAGTLLAYSVPWPKVPAKEKSWGEEASTTKAPPTGSRNSSDAISTPALERGCHRYWWNVPPRTQPKKQLEANRG